MAARTVDQIIAQAAQMNLHDVVGPNMGAAAVAAQCVPKSAPAGEAALIEASLRVRGFPYWKTTIGDCPSPTSTTQGLGAQIGIQGTQIASTAGLTALETAGIISGPATLGIGAAVGFAIAGVEDLLQHHSAAVKKEQDTLCYVSGTIDNALPKIDAGVSSGAITPEEGASLVGQLMDQMTPILATIQQVCNAACAYSGVILGHKQFALIYYRQIAPMRVTAQAPGAAPTAFGSNPGGVPATIQYPPPPVPPRALQVNLPQPINTQPKAQANYFQATNPGIIQIPTTGVAPTPPNVSGGITLSTPMLLLVGAGVVVLILVLR
jgi:hypothetical protein